MMKYHFSILLILLLGACSSRPNTNIIVEKEEHLMHRQEVINAIEDCKTANLRPVLFYSHRYVNERAIPMIADVTCAPRSGY